MKSHDMVTTRSGVIDANASMITGLSLKNPAHSLCPKDRAETTQIARTIVNLRVTIMALLALLGFPLPNSFDTLVLQELIKTEHITSLANKENDVRFKISSFVNR